MPRYTERTLRARAILKGYLKLRKWRQLRLLRKAQLSQDIHVSSESSSDSLSDLSSDSDFSSSIPSGSSCLDSDSDSDSDARSASRLLSQGPFPFPLELMDLEEGILPVNTTCRRRMGHSEAESEESSGEDGDDEEEVEEDGGDVSKVCGPPTVPPSCLGRRVRDALGNLYANRYQAARNTLPRGPAYLPHVLHTLKHSRPDEFRANLRVNPRTFDRLVTRLMDDPIFSNDSQNPQMSVEEQVAITLYRFGHHGNAAGLQKVANWAGCAKGTVDLVTRRVMTAVLRPDFLAEAIRYPTPEEKEKAKVWVESHSCKAWRNGWWMVDGTLIPLEERPFWYGESYFDRKCNYSLNLQVVSLPNLRIVDVGYGFTGSTHDATAWAKTHIAQNHESILAEGEFIFADSAYPIAVWVTAPYKMPERELPDNERFNNHVSIVRIRSEHAIGFLKGRFQSLKGLRIRIIDERSHKFATYWVLACVAIHSFAMQCEEEERRAEGEDSDGVDDDPFIYEGLSSSSEESEGVAEHGFDFGAHVGTRLQQGRAWREHLKYELFRAKEKRAERRRRAHRQGWN